MPYKSKRKQKAYADRWRRSHPAYMRDYYRNCVRPLTGRMKQPVTLDPIREKNAEPSAVSNA